MTSICRRRHEDGTRTLRDYRQELFTGFEQSQVRSESSPPPALRAAGEERLLSLVDARADGSALVMKLLQVRRGGCLYDLLLVAREALFPIHEAEFDRFVGEFKTAASER